MTPQALADVFEASAVDVYFGLDGTEWHVFISPGEVLRAVTEGRVVLHWAPLSVCGIEPHLWLGTHAVPPRADVHQACLSVVADIYRGLSDGT